MGETCEQGFKWASGPCERGPSQHPPQSAASSNQIRGIARGASHVPGDFGFGMVSTIKTRELSLTVRNKSQSESITGYMSIYDSVSVSSSFTLYLLDP